MITLITFPAGFGCTSVSPFCAKAVYLLNMSKAQWQREDVNDPRSYPKAKLPAIKVNEEVIGDSDGIRHYLESTGVDFDKGLSDIEKANSRAFIRMAEEHMYFHQVLDRWGNDQVWPILRDEYFNEIPRLIRGFVTGGLRRTLLKGMVSQGLGRLSEAERMAKLEPDLAAIIARLWQSPFLFADHPTAADASVAALLDGMRATPLDTLLSKRIRDDTVLSAYVDRMNDALLRNAT